MSWLFSQALVEAFSEDTSWDGGQCAQLNVVPSAQPFWRNDKPMDVSRFSRFGLTSRPLTAEHGEALLMWFREAFLARTSASPAQETDLTESAQDSGKRWPGSLAKWDPDTSTWRTAQCSLLGGWDEFSATWPASGSMRNGECWERPTLELHTSESESGLLPTPVTIDTGSRFNRSPSPGAALRPTLGAMARFDLWPTPVARDFRSPGRSRLERTGGKQGECLPQVVGGPLNPDWVEWLMGWPIGWTALQPLAMDRFREWQQQHGADCATGDV